MSDVTILTDGQGEIVVIVEDIDGELLDSWLVLEQERTTLRVMPDPVVAPTLQDALSTEEFEVDGVDGYTRFMAWAEAEGR